MCRKFSIGLAPPYLRPDLSRADDPHSSTHCNVILRNGHTSSDGMVNGGFVPLAVKGNSELPPSSAASGAALAPCRTRPAAPPPWPPSSTLSPSPPPAPAAGPVTPPSPGARGFKAFEYGDHNNMFHVVREMHSGSEIYHLKNRS